MLKQKEGEGERRREGGREREREGERERKSRFCDTRGRIEDHIGVYVVYIKRERKKM